MYSNVPQGQIRFVGQWILPSGIIYQRLRHGKKTIYDPFPGCRYRLTIPFAKGPRQLHTRGSCGLLSYIHAPRHLSVFSRSRWQKAKKLVYAISLPPPPTGTEQSVLTRAYTLHLPLGSLPLSPLKYVNVAKRALRALKWWPTRSMTWTTTWQSSADCRSGQLPVIYDSKPSSSPIKIKDSAFPQQSDSTGPICQVRLSWQKRAAENHVTRQKSRFFFSSL